MFDNYPCNCRLLDASINTLNDTNLTFTREILEQSIKRYNNLEGLIVDFGSYDESDDQTYYFNKEMVQDLVCYFEISLFCSQLVVAACCCRFF